MMAAVMTTGLVLTGCGSKETAVETSKDAAVETSKQEEATQEKVTLKMHLHTNNKFTILNKDGEILPVYQLAAEKTNVILENVANPVAQKSAEEFQLQATEKFPADIYGGASLKDPIFTYALQGAFICAEYQKISGRKSGDQKGTYRTGWKYLYAELRAGRRSRTCLFLAW